MAKKDIPEMVKITLDTSNMQDFNDLKEPLGTFRGALKTLDSDLSAFERVIKSASNYFEFFNNNLKKVNEKTGLAEQSFFVRKDELDNVLFALNSKAKELTTGKDSLGFNITYSDVEILQSTRKVLGKEAQKMAIEEVNRLGGKASVNPKNKDKLDIELPVSKSLVQEMSSAEKSALITQAIPYGRKLSGIEGRKRKKEELARLSEEEMERTMAEVEAVKSQKLAEDKAKQDAEKLLEKAKKDEEREKKEKKARQKSEIRKVLSVAKTVGATLIIIADIVRRILTATLKSASENEKKAMEAHSVGVTAMQRRNLDLFDIAHGMEKGTSFGAIQSVQSLFGNITSLDEKALSTLARVMGSEISDLVTSGMGGKNPDQLLDKILDKYFSQYLSGKNSLGQSVGREEARRELITSLQSVSPEIAKVFARMVDDYASGYYKPFSNSKGWRDTVLLNRTGLTEADLDFNAEIGKKYNEIIAIVNDLKDGFFERLATSMDGLLTKVKNLRIGQSEDNKIEEDIRNKQKNEESKQQMKTALKLYNTSSAEKIKELGSIENTPISTNAFGAKNYTENQAKRFKYNAEILAGIQSGIYDEKYFKQNFKEYGMTSADEAKAYIKRAKDVMDNAMFSSEVQDEIARAVVIIKQMKKIDEANENDIGSGKIADLSMTEAQETFYAQKFAEDWGRSIAGRNGILSSQPSEVQRTYKDAYFNYLLDNPEAFNNELNNMTATTKKAFTKNADKIAKEKGTKKEKLSREDKIRAFVEANADWSYSTTFIPQRYMQTKGTALDTYLMKEAGIDARNNINIADSKIRALLARQNATLSPNKSYSLSGSQGQSGEYVLKLQMLDSSGRETGQPISMTFSDTKGRTGDLGKVTTDSKGNVVYATAQ